MSGKASLSARIDPSFSCKVSKGIIWVTGSSICARGLSFISAIILARLLVPSDFGLMAIVMAIITLSQQTTETGFGSALIQRQDRSEDLLNTAWTFELIRYLILSFIMFLAAPLFALFLKEPRVVAILRVITLSFVFQGMSNIGVIYFRKNLDFRKQFILEIAPIVANILVVIPLAFFLRNVWALVWATLTSSMATCVISYFIHPYRPCLEFETKKARELFNFGKWIFGSSLINMAKREGVTMFIGKFLGMSTLGFYNRAGVFSDKLFQQMVGMVWKLGYPAYSQLQVDPIKLKQACLKTLQLLAFIGIPMAGGLFVLSRDFVLLFLTNKWLQIVPLIQILCLQAIIGFINTPIGIVFQASGRPSIGTKISALGVIVLIIFLYPLSSRWGVVGAVFSLFLSILLPSPIIWYAGIKIIGCSFSEFFKPVLFPLINTGVMISIILIIKKIIFMQVNFVEFFGLIFIGIIIYFAITYLFDRHLNYGCYRLIRKRLVVLRENF